MAFDSLTLNETVLWLFYFLWKNAPRFAPSEKAAWLTRELSDAVNLDPQPEECIKSDFNASPCVSKWALHVWPDGSTTSVRKKKSSIAGAAQWPARVALPANTVAQVHTHPDKGDPPASPRPSGPEGTTADIERELKANKDPSDVRVAQNYYLPVYVVSASALWKVDYTTLQKIQLAGADWYATVASAVDAISPAKSRPLMGVLARFGSRKGLTRRAIEEQDFRSLV
jgi:hypothetical protein